MPDTRTNKPPIEVKIPAGAADPPPRQTLDVVIPVLNEQDNLPELIRRLTETCGAIDNCDWSILFVDDGSTDSTRRMILEHRERDPRFCLLSLSRNFGHQPAITAGLDHSRADAVVIMDADLQDPPEVIAAFVQRWRTGADVVIGVRRSRKETGVRRLGFEAFHRGMRYLVDHPIPPNAGVFGLLSRAAADELLRLTERNRFFPGLRSWIGFEQGVVEYDRDQRAAGAPKQSLTRLARYAMDGVLSFSYKPLRYMMYAGVAISLFGFCVAAYFILNRLLGFERAITGFTTLVTLMLFLGGIQLIAIGLLGEYLGRIYDEVKNRPLYIVRERHGVGRPGRVERAGAEAL